MYVVPPAHPNLDKARFKGLSPHVAFGCGTRQLSSAGVSERGATGGDGPSRVLQEVGACRGEWRGKQDIHLLCSHP